MKKKDIIDAIQERLGFSRRETTLMVNSALEIIKLALEKGEPVNISSFGKFSVRSKKARRGRNPKTGEAIIIPAQKAITFKVSQVLKEAVNAANQDGHSG
nr:integration host factor subunit alpha [Desulfobacterales bacterium]